MLTLTQRLPATPEIVTSLTLSLTADERTRSRYSFETQDGQTVYLQLPRGTVLHQGDLLADATGKLLIRVVAAAEPVLTVTAKTTLELLRGAYHLGNRHVPLEITPTYLRLSADPVLQSLLEHMGLRVIEEIAPFQPESGAYSHHHPK